MQQIKNLILDMDGVLWRGDTPMPQLAAFFAGLDELGIQYIMATNNATKTAAQYVKRFAGFGIDMPPERILGSAEATAQYLRTQYPAGTRAFVVGEQGLHDAMTAQGFEVVSTVSAETQSSILPQTVDNVDLVVSGFTRYANYTHFAAATWYIRNGARFVGTNGDLTIPSEMGPLPGAGSILSLLQTSTGVEPTVIGKPGPIMFQEALKRVSGSAENTAMVGDRLATDIQGATNAGIHSIMVLSGINTRADVASGTIKPTFIVDDINDLLAKLRASNTL
jgi:4-nitrophenyl phosphatase